MSTNSTFSAGSNLLEKGVGTVVVTLGAEGPGVHTKDGRRSIIPTLSVDAVDTTGAGDTFVAIWPLDWPAVSRSSPPLGAVASPPRSAPLAPALSRPSPPRPRSTRQRRLRTRDAQQARASGSYARATQSGTRRAPPGSCVPEIPITPPVQSMTRQHRCAEPGRRSLEPKCSPTPGPPPAKASRALSRFRRARPPPRSTQPAVSMLSLGGLNGTGRNVDRYHPLGPRTLPR